MTWLVRLSFLRIALMAASWPLMLYLVFMAYVVFARFKPHDGMMFGTYSITSRGALVMIVPPILFVALWAFARMRE